MYILNEFSGSKRKVVGSFEQVKSFMVIYREFGEFELILCQLLRIERFQIIYWNR